MKKYLIIALVAICFLSCGHDEEQTYTDLFGKWEFNSESYHGSFTLVKSTADNSNYMIETGAIFYLEDEEYVTVENIRLDVKESNPNILDGFVLGFGYNGYDNPSIWFDELEFNEDFTEFIANDQVYMMCDICSSVNSAERVVFSRR